MLMTRAPHSIWLSDAARGLGQQMVFWGHDVRHGGGNGLTRHGLARTKSPGLATPRKPERMVAGRHRLRNPGRLDQQRIKAPFFRQPRHLQHQVLAQRAADAAIRHLNELFLGLRKRGISAAQGLGIDIHLAHVEWG